MAEQKIYGYNRENRDREDHHGLPKNWREYDVIGETKISWLVGFEPRPTKVNKKTFVSSDGVIYVPTLADIAKTEYVWNTRYKLGEAVKYCKDYDKLKEIQRILEEN